MRSSSTVSGSSSDTTRTATARRLPTSPCRVRIRCASSCSAGPSGWPTSTRSQVRHGITSSTDTIRRTRSSVRRCARWETVTSPPGEPRPSRRPGRCTTRAPTRPGCSTGSSTTCAGTEIDNESLVNLPNWLSLTFRIDDGSWFDIDAVTVLSHRQTLDLRGAVLHREVRFRDDAGRTSSLRQRRFVAMHLPHVGALETTVVAEDWSGTIEFRSTVDGNVTNSLVERYRDLASEHLGSAVTREISNNSVLLTVRDQPVADPRRHGRAKHRAARRRTRPRDISAVQSRRRDRSRHRGTAVGRRVGDDREGRDRLHGPRRGHLRTRRRRAALGRQARPGSPNCSTDI